MTDQRCVDLRSDLTALESHSATCADCALHLRNLEAFDSELAGADLEETFVPDVALKLDLEQLPVAAWEDAGHRSWPLVTMAMAILLLVTIALFVVAGISPLRGFVAAVSGGTLFQGDAVRVATAFSAGVKQAPLSFHLTLAAAFFAVNAILIVLLRRSMRGYDVGPR